MRFIPAKDSDATIAAACRQFLQEVVRIDSSSDERSATIPSTEGQRVLADHLADFFAAHGCTIERDGHANMIATLPARGTSGVAPIALIIHVDTARGTAAVDGLNVVEKWQGERISYPENPGLDVSIESYPSLATFLGHDLLHGPGDAPFGLDDKLGLTHMMTLAWLLAANPEIPHPTLHFIGRPDEEIGRMEALTGLAGRLRELGVSSGYTIDGLEPYEVNIENFNASQGSIFFEASPFEASAGETLRVFVGGVNTHGATAKVEGHRPATRFVAEIFSAIGDAGLDREIKLLSFTSDPLRDCDATMTVLVTSEEARAAFESHVEAVVGPHLGRGATFSVEEADGAATVGEGAATAAIAFVGAFLKSAPGFTLCAEDSEHFDGYSQPYRILETEGGLTLDLRLRDFDPEALARRERHVESEAAKLGLSAQIQAQYVNMGPKLANRPELVEWARDAGQGLGIEPRVLPIRGGTGVDPFLDVGVAIANLGTGYFAPESEKELTSLQHMVGHARWLINLVQAIDQKR